MNAYTIFSGLPKSKEVSTFSTRYVMMCDAEIEPKVQFFGIDNHAAVLSLGRSWISAHKLGRVVVAIYDRDQREVVKWMCRDVTP